MRLQHTYFLNELYSLACTLVAVIYILSGAVRANVLHWWRAGCRHWQQNFHQSVRRQRFFVGYVLRQNVGAFWKRKSRPD